MSYCPLCNSAVVFDRRVSGRTLRFGTTGKLRNSDLVMWDRQTESWWQQLTGEGLLVGRYAGARLRPLNSQTLSWAQFKARYPHGTVMSRPTGFDRPYGVTPYSGYAREPGRPRLYDGALDPRLPPRERVIAVHLGRRVGVIPFSVLSGPRVMTARLGATPIVVLYEPAVGSVLDTYTVRASRDVGTAAAFVARSGGHPIDLVADARGGFRDRDTGSRWDITGHATGGALKGTQLRRLHTDQQFWFALAAFLPHARLLQPHRPAGRAPDVAALAAQLRHADVVVDPAVARLVDVDELRRATRIASRAADGDTIKLAFLDVEDSRLDGLRDRLFSTLGLAREGALVLATPVSIAMRTATLQPAAEQAIVEHDGAPLRSPPRDYTTILGELVYDTGLVIHNSRPGPVPRGSGANRNLRTFTRHFEGEHLRSRRPWTFIAAAIPAAGLVVLFAHRRRRRRRADRGSPGPEAKSA